MGLFMPTARNTLPSVVFRVPLLRLKIMAFWIARIPRSFNTMPCPNATLYAFVVKVNVHVGFRSSSRSCGGNLQTHLQAEARRDRAFPLSTNRGDAKRAIGHPSHPLVVLPQRKSHSTTISKGLSLEHEGAVMQRRYERVKDSRL